MPTPPPPSLVEDYVDVLSVSGHFQPSTSDQFPVSVSLSQKAETLTPICHGQARLPFSWHRVIHEQDAQAKGFKNSLAFGFLHNCLQTTWIVYMCVCVSKVFWGGGRLIKSDIKQHEIYHNWLCKPHLCCCCYLNLLNNSIFLMFYQFRFKTFCHVNLSTHISERTAHLTNMFLILAWVTFGLVGLI